MRTTFERAKVMPLEACRYSPKFAPIPQVPRNPLPPILTANWGEIWGIWVQFGNIVPLICRNRLTFSGKTLALLAVVAIGVDVQPVNFCGCVVLKLGCCSWGWVHGLGCTCGGMVAGASAWRVGSAVGRAWGCVGQGTPEDSPCAKGGARSLAFYVQTFIQSFANQYCWYYLSDIDNFVLCLFVMLFCYCFVFVLLLCWC